AQAEACAGPGRVERQGAAVLLGDLACDGEAEAAALTLGRRAADAGEEDRLAIGIRDAAAAVADAHLGAPARRADADRDRADRAGVAEGVVEQVVERPFDARGVARDGRGRRAPQQPDGDAALAAG